MTRTLSALLCLLALAFAAAPAAATHNYCDNEQSLVEGGDDLDVLGLVGFDQGFNSDPGEPYGSGTGYTVCAGRLSQKLVLLAPPQGAGAMAGLVVCDGYAPTGGGCDVLLAPTGAGVVLESQDVDLVCVGETCYGTFVLVPVLWVYVQGEPVMP